MIKQDYFKGQLERTKSNPNFVFKVINHISHETISTGGSEPFYYNLLLQGAG